MAKQPYNWNQGWKPRVSTPAPAPVIQKDDDSFGQNLLEGLEQGGKSMLASGAYLAADIGERFTSDDTWAQDMKKWATEYKKTAPESDGSVGQFLGSLLPSTVPTVAAIGTAIVAPPLGAAMAYGSLATLGAASMGEGMMSYDEYKQSKGELADPTARLFTGLAYGVAEYIPEKIGLKFLMKGTKFNPAAKIFMKGGDIPAAEQAGKSIFAKVYEQQPELVAKLTKNIIKGGLVEGTEESTTQLLTLATDVMYKDWEDNPTWQEAGKQVGMAWLGGAIMGSGIGPLSYKAQQVGHRERRIKQGSVYLAEDSQTGHALEIVARNKETGTVTALDPSGEILENVPETRLGQTVQLSPKQFENVLKGKLDEVKIGEYEQRQEEAQIIERQTQEFNKASELAFQDDQGQSVLEFAEMPIDGQIIPVLLSKKEADPNNRNLVVAYPMAPNPQGGMPLIDLNSERIFVDATQAINVTRVPLEQLRPGKIVSDPQKPIQSGEVVLYEGQEYFVVSRPDRDSVTLKNEDGDTVTVTKAEYIDLKALTPTPNYQDTLGNLPTDEKGNIISPEEFAQNQEAEGQKSGVDPEKVGQNQETTAIRALKVGAKKTVNLNTETNEVDQTYETRGSALGVAKQLNERYEGSEFIVENRTDFSDGLGQAKYVITRRQRTEEEITAIKEGKRPTKAGANQGDGKNAGGQPKGKGAQPGVPVDPIEVVKKDFNVTITETDGVLDVQADFDKKTFQPRDLQVSAARKKLKEEGFNVSDTEIILPAEKVQEEKATADESPVIEKKSKAQKEREREESGKKVSSKYEKVLAARPQNLYQAVVQYFLAGGKINTKVYQEETGFGSVRKGKVVGQGDFMKAKRSGILDDNGLGIDDIATSISGKLSAEDGYNFDMSQEALRNEIISVLTELQTKEQMFQHLKETYSVDGKVIVDDMDRLDAEMKRQEEEYLARMSPDDLAVYEEYGLSDVLELTDERAQILAENDNELFEFLNDYGNDKEAGGQPTGEAGNENDQDIEGEEGDSPRFQKAPSIESEAFKKWFGDSKVVNPDGSPMVVYHGMPDTREFKETYTFKTRDEIFFGKEDGRAYFFTNSLSKAKSYADPKRAFDYQGAEEGIISTYISIQNPLTVDGSGSIWRNFQTTINGTEISGTRQLVEYAQKNGYDGLIVNNIKDNYNNNDKVGSKAGNVYVAFSPTQIKSATGNIGTFDSNNPDIRFQKPTNQTDLFGTQPTERAETKRDKLTRDQKTATNRLRQLVRLPESAKSNLVREEIEALKKEVLRLNEAIAKTLPRDQATAGGQQATLFQNAPKGFQGAASKIFAPFKLSIRDKVEADVQRVVKNWKNAPQVVVWESSADAVFSGAITGLNTEHLNGFTAFYDPQTDTVHFASDAIGGDGTYRFNSLSKIENTIFHEMFGHYGLRGMIKKLSKDQRKSFTESFHGLLDQVYKEFSDSEIMAQVRKDYSQRPGQSKEAHERELAEEYIAKIAESNENPTFMERVISLVRQMISDITGSPSRLTDAEIRVIVANAKKFVQVGDTNFSRAEIKKAYKEQILATSEFRKQVNAMRMNMNPGNAVLQRVETKAGPIDITSFMNNGNLYVMSKSGNMIVGTAMFDPQGVPQSVDVDESYQRKGIATEMYRHAIEQGIELGRGEIQTEEGQAFRDSAKFQIIGENANLKQTARENLGVARQMEESNKDAKTIRLATGWERGADGKWRYEIEDGQINKEVLKELDRNKELANQEVIFDLVTYKKNIDGTYHVNIKKKGATKTSEIIEYKSLAKADLLTILENKEVVDSILNNEGKDSLIGENLDDAKEIKKEFTAFVSGGEPLILVLDNKELYSAYPQLKGAIVVINPKMASEGTYSVRDGQVVIEVKSASSNATRGTIIHEIQHAIQDIEGFARGGSPIQFLKSQNLFAELKERLELILQVDELAKKNNVSPKRIVENAGYKEWEVEYLNNYTDSEKDWKYVVDIAKDKILTPEQKYRRLAGEVEARNVQSRMSMTLEQRMSTTLQETEDVSREDQILLFGDDSPRFQKNINFENYANETGDQEVREGTLQKVRRNNFQNAYSYIRTGIEAVSGNEQITLQHKNAKEYAKANGLWVNKLSDLGTETDFGGMENRIAINTEKGEIYKSNNLFVHKGDILSYINYIQRHNYLFPTTAYDLVGFQEVMKDRKPWIKPIVKQKFITGEGVRKATQEEIDAYMRKRGYYSNDRNAFSYENMEFEISDLKPANVLFKDGEIFVIDNITKKFKAEDLRFQLAPSVDTPEFKRWFGKSKVVNGDGSPKALYHGSKEAFTKFDYGKIGKNATSEGKGFYFTDDKGTAMGYAEDGNIYEVYISMQNPLPIGQKNFSKLVVKKIINEVAKMESARYDMEIADGYLSNFGDVRYDGLNAVLEEAASMMVGNETASDLISDIINSGSDLEIVAGAVQKITGYDGIISDGFSNEGKGGGTIYVAFFPNQIKSVNNQGTFDPQNPDIRFQKSPDYSKDNFYSNSLKALSNINQNKATGDQWKAMLLNNGASQAELAWIDFDGFLKDNTKPTKEQVMEFIEGNKVEVVEVLKKDEAKFSRYTLIGGENYREVLFIIPLKGKEQRYISPQNHFDEPGILAHIRMNDRMLDGQKVLFVEEIQSDHSQDLKAGRTTVPTPFPQTSQWVNLTLRRVIRIASEEGYDQVAFISGEQSAYRYDLKNGIKDFYDKIIPAQVKKVLAKVDKSVKLEEIDLSDKTATKSQINKFGKGENERFDARIYTDEETIAEQQGFKTKEEAEKWIELYNPTKQLSFPITPTIRNIAMSEGMPMFQRTQTLDNTDEERAAMMSTGLSRWDEVRTKTQDYLLIGKRLIQKEYGDLKFIPDNLNFYNAENVASSKTKSKTDFTLEEFFNPLIESIKDSKASYQEASDYIYARGAISRNKEFVERGIKDREKQLSKIKDQKSATAKNLQKEIDKLRAGDFTGNLETFENNSGLTNQEAQAIIDDFQAKYPRDYKKIFDQKVRLTRRIAEMELEYGLIDQSRFEMKVGNVEYAPLRGFASTNYDPTRMSGDYTAKGRKSKGDDPLGYLAVMAQTVIHQGEQNVVKRHLLDFMEANPDLSLYNIRNAYYVEQVDVNENISYLQTYTKPAAGINFKRKLDPTDTLIEPVSPIETETISVMVDGRKVTMEFYGAKGMKLARAVKGADLNKVSDWLKYVGGINRKLSQLYTTYSPEFTMRNFFRDFITVGINVRNDFGVKTTSEVYSRLPKAMAALKKAVRNKEYAGKYGTYLRQFEENGGLTGFATMQEMAEYKNNAQKLIDNLEKPKVWPLQMWDKSLQFIQDYNKVVENGVRLATFITLMEKGHGVQKSIAYSKDVSVNFNRRGEWSSNMGALYLFVNAGIQGTERLSRAFFSIDQKTKTRAIQTAIALPILSIALGILNRLGAGEDDDGEFYYDKLSDYERQFNLMVPNIMSEKKGDFLKIPLPYGFNVMFAIPDHFVRFLMGKESFGEMALNTFATINDSFNPLGGVEFKDDVSGATNLGRILSPTATDPIFDLAFNSNFAGLPIYPSTYPGQPEKPDSQKYFRNVNPVIKSITTKINELTGGDERVPGHIDVSPETIEHLVGSYGGGTYNFSQNMIAFGANLLAEPNTAVSFEDDNIKKVPVIRGYVGYPMDYQNQRLFIENFREIKAKEQIYNGYVKDRRTERAREFRQENNALINLSGLAKQTDKKVQALKERADAMSVLGDQGKERIKLIEEQINNEYLRFNKRYNEITKNDGVLTLQELF